MTPRTRNLLLGFAALGLIASSASTYVHYRLLTVPAYSSVCDISSTVSCTEAYLSRYGSFWGVPVAIGGVAFFALVLLITALGGRRPSRSSPASRVSPVSTTSENVPAYIFAMSTIALAFVLYLAWASFFQLKAVCLLCVTTYVAVVAVFIISGGATKFPMTTLPRRATRDAGHSDEEPGGTADRRALRRRHRGARRVVPRRDARQPRLSRPRHRSIRRSRISNGPTSKNGGTCSPRSTCRSIAARAKVLVVKFNDFQCPPCRLTYNEYRGILAKYTATGEVKYVLKHFPLDPECNPANAGHQAACEAAAAYVLAKPKGTSDKLEAWLFANQPTLTPDLVKQGAAQTGGITDFDAQYAGAMAQVKEDIGLGAKLEVRSTPTFFINGRKVGGLTGQAFEAAIELELKRSR